MRRRITTKTSAFARGMARAFDINGTMPPRVIWSSPPREANRASIREMIARDGHAVGGDLRRAVESLKKR